MATRRPLNRLRMQPLMGAAVERRERPRSARERAARGARGRRGERSGRELRHVRVFRRQAVSHRRKAFGRQPFRRGAVERRG
jgi:hypothetical protein